MRGCLTTLFQEFVLVPVIAVAVFAVVLTAKFSTIVALLIGCFFAIVVAAVLFVRTQKRREPPTSNGA